MRLERRTHETGGGHELSGVERTSRGWDDLAIPPPHGVPVEGRVQNGEAYPSQPFLCQHPLLPPRGQERVSYGGGESEPWSE